MQNINTKEYWDRRFENGDWESNSGREQSYNFAKSQMPFIDLSLEFDGTMLDFGCGLGDAFSIYKEAYPKARLIGVDISEAAIKKCKGTYGQLGEFICGDYTDIPNVDVIIASNVFEHLDDDKKIARHLLSKCKKLYIIVPYKEQEPLSQEHIRVYDEYYFNEFSLEGYSVFKSLGWSENGWRDLYYAIYFKNILRFVLSKNMRHQRKQIIFRLIPNEKNTIL